MGRVAGRDEALGIQHQSLVGAGLVGLNAGQDAVQFGMAVELWVLDVRRAASDMHGEQPQTRHQGSLRRHLVFRNNHDGRWCDRHLGMLIGRRLDAAGDHQANMDVRGHLVGAQQGVYALSQRRLVGANGEIQRLGTTPGRRVVRPRPLRARSRPVRVRG